MFLGALKNLENLLQSGEEEDANKFVESLDIAWACKSVKVDLSALAKDDLSTSLLPEDISSKPVGNPVALHTTGNGNCLYNSASVILCGNELRSHPLRILVAKELYFNAEFYASHEIFKITEENSGIAHSVLFPVALSRDGDRILAAGGSRADAVRGEAIAGCKDGNWSCLLHVMALASVLKRPVYSLYPNVQFRFRTLMQNVLKPRLTVLDDQTANPVYVLWTRDGDLDSGQQTWYVPNHLVPVIWLPYQASDKVPPPATGREVNRPGPKQGSILSFFKGFSGPSKAKTAEKRSATRAGLDEGKKPPPGPGQTSAVKRKFLPHWKEEFPWVVYHGDQNKMTCEICCSIPELAGKTDFLTGCSTFKKETLQKHSVSGPHLRARNGLLAKQKPLQDAPIAQSLHKGRMAVEEQNRKEMAVKINTAYVIAKEELPFSKFGPLLALQKKNGVEINSTYSNDKSCAEMVSVIGKVCRDQLTEEVTKANYISVMADGATDVGGVENETVYCRFLRDGRPVNCLVGHIAVEHATAEGVKEGINGTFENAGLSSWKTKAVAFGADGASVNLGKKGGVSALLKKEVPYLLDFHCLPHRLELALQELQKSCESVECVYSVLHLIWKTYHYSPKSVRSLRTIADELTVNILKPSQVSGTRWLPHVSRALNVFVGRSDKGSLDEAGQYAAVLIHMEDLSVTSKSADIKGRAKFVAAKMRDVQFAAFCHFLADLFSVLSKLSLQMQRNDLILPTCVSLLKETITRVECIKSRPIPDGHLAKFLKKVESSSSFQGLALNSSLEGKVKRGGGTSKNLQSEIDKAVHLCKQRLTDRFDVLINASKLGSKKQAVYGSENVIHDMLILNVDAWPSDVKDLVDYGSEEIERLVEWFRPVLQKTGCNIEAIQDQWRSMKMLVKSQFQKLDYVNLWQTFLTKVPYKDNFKDVLNLVEIVLVLPISAAQCERAVSAQNRIKSSVRSSLTTSMLEDLIRISSEGPPAVEFDPSASIDRWFSRDKSKGERARRPNFKT